MPRPHTTIPNFLPPLHLYRNLLRESSYLPPAFRSTITSVIRVRFRNHRRKDPLQRDHRSQANNALRTLRAANSGHHKCMEKLIQKGFARTGPRRRTLITEFVGAQGPSDSDALEAIIDGASPKATDDAAAEAPEPTSKRDDNVSLDDPLDQGASENEQQEYSVGRGKNVPKSTRNRFYEKWDIPKLKQLLKSQRELQRDTEVKWLKRDLKNLDDSAHVPKANIWGKPPAENLVRAKRAHYWRSAVSKMMVPLGNGEWDLLGRLSSGAQNLDEWKVPERRPAAKPKHGVEQGQPLSDWNWETYASKPIVDAERKNSSILAVRLGEKLKQPYEGQYEQREISARWFRRVYRQTWNITPKMDQDPQSLRHKFTWGSLKSPAVRPSDEQLAIFEGVNLAGRKPAPVDKQKTS
ncbi:hypothetical protein FZEAL_2902 [Fusarium zealandicum]|uniref:LYR motif-containing protein Cup1-like N-terminal domain-containing protein n=1 Tax=Fusarium zealandicum TaxID=1053134 RepID=A0A8H4XN41_9HYPO|nr:hypothetical protein FZEAL_2902 [Fusarium zealandicum]